MSIEKIEWLPYRPSNGTEGAMFFDQWCSRCAKDSEMNSGKSFDECESNEVCDLIGNSFAYDEDHPNYPKEWRIPANVNEWPKGAECTAFVPVGESIPQRCTLTRDMFEEAFTE